MYKRGDYIPRVETVEGFSGHSGQAILHDLLWQRSLQNCHEYELRRVEGCFNHT